MGKIPKISAKTVHRSYKLYNKNSSDQCGITPITVKPTYILQCLLWWLIFVVHYICKTYNPEMKGTLSIQILMQEDNMPFILILRLEDTGF